MLIMVLFYTQYNICEGAVSNGFWIIKSLAAIKDSETRLEMMILEERACSHHPHWPGGAHLDTSGQEMEVVM